MVRRLFRLAVAGFCLLSLLACLGAGWLWWRMARGHLDYTQASAGGVYLFGMSNGRGVAALAVRDWPGPPVARVRTVVDWGDVVYYRVRPAAFWARPGRAGLAALAELPGGSGELTASLGPDGLPLAWGQAEGPQGARASGPLPYWTTYNVPHWLPVAATALPPFLWLGVRTRRDLALRRRRRLGLCLDCGYDLRGSRESGRCPECGTPARR